MIHHSARRIPAWAVCLVVTAFLVTINAFVSKTPTSPIDDLARSISETYQVKISLEFRPESGDSEHDPICANSLSLADCGVILRLLKSELALYPCDFIRGILLKQIVICENLSQNGQKKGAISDFTHEILYLSYNPLEEPKEIKSRDIHHELFHMIDARDDGRFEDETWSGLNLQSFRYGNGHGRQWIDTPGFLSGYATLDAAEDKAELFSYMITDYGSVQSRAKDDLVIRRKLAAMKALLANQCPEMDTSFWTRRVP